MSNLGLRVYIYSVYIFVYCLLLSPYSSKRICKFVALLLIHFLNDKKDAQIIWSSDLAQEKTFWLLTKMKINKHHCKILEKNT